LTPVEMYVACGICSIAVEKSMFIDVSRLPFTSVMKPRTSSSVDEYASV
jgi:hypothetical protein